MLKHLHEDYKSHRSKSAKDSGDEKEAEDTGNKAGGAEKKSGSKADLTQAEFESLMPKVRVKTFQHFQRL